MTNIPHEDLKEHTRACPLEIVQCQYHDIECEVKVARKNLIKHDEEKINERLLMMKSVLIDTQNKLCDTESKLSDTQHR